MGFCLKRRGVSVSMWFLSAFDCGWDFGSPFSLPLIVCMCVCLQCPMILGCQNTREDRLLLLLVVMVLSLQVHLPNYSGNLL